MNAITTEMLSGVLDQLTALIPVVIPKQHWGLME